MQPRAIHGTPGGNYSAPLSLVLLFPCLPSPAPTLHVRTCPGESVPHPGKAPLHLTQPPPSAVAIDDGG